MKKIKNLTLGILGATILSLGLFSCSNEDATTANNITEQKTVAGKSFSDVKIIPSTLGFGRAYDVRLKCISATSGFCVDLTLPGPGTHPSDGIGRIDHFTMRLSMSITTYQTNKEYFREGTFVIDNDFVLSPEVLNELEYNPETRVIKQVAKVVQADDKTFYIDLNVKQN